MKNTPAYFFSQEKDGSSMAEKVEFKPEEKEHIDIAHKDEALEIPQFKAEEEQPATQAAKPPEQAEITIEERKTLLKACLASVGETVAFISKVEEAKFDEEEQNALSEVWAPFLPPVSNLVIAIVATTSIMTKKLIILVHITRERKKTGAKPADTQTAGKTAEEPAKSTAT